MRAQHIKIEHLFQAGAIKPLRGVARRGHKKRTPVTPQMMENHVENIRLRKSPLDCDAAFA